MNSAQSGNLKAGESLSGLQALIERAGLGKSSLPPVERWNPEYCGDIDMEIKRDGTWFYMGTPIGRMPLVRLFASVLRKDEDGKTYLVTPVEKIGIRVEDAPFLVVEMHHEMTNGTPRITFRTNVGDVVEAGTDHPIRFVEEPDYEGVKPYVHIRGRLEALLARPVMYELISHGRDVIRNGESVFAVESNGVQFPIMPTDELARRVGDG